MIWSFIALVSPLRAMLCLLVVDGLAGFLALLLSYLPREWS
ncbi:MAG: hypothetical protein NTZ90_16360 [Proteobacteria bacterium]|nr:hypothetical protein [Pseudomonadota bacterium]